LSPLLVVNQVKTGKHSLVQYSADEDAVVISPVKDDVLFVLDTAVSLADSNAGAADSRSFDKPIKTGFQAVERTLGLLRTPSVHRVVGYIHEGNIHQF